MRKLEEVENLPGAARKKKENTAAGSENRFSHVCGWQPVGLLCRLVRRSLSVGRSVGRSMSIVCFPIPTSACQSSRYKFGFCVFLFSPLSDARLRVPPAAWLMRSSRSL